MNTNRSDDLMMNIFEKKMGSPEDIIIILGDWSNKGIKGKSSTISKKLRKLLIDRGYEVLLIDEYNTSKLCSCCHELTEQLKITEDADPLWKLVKCKSCGSIHNRDHNSTKNMRYITNSIIKGKGRPKKYQRPEEKTQK
jgi:hypothetical protein